MDFLLMRSENVPKMRFRYSDRKTTNATGKITLHINEVKLRD